MANEDMSDAVSDECERVAYEIEGVRAAHDVGRHVELYAAVERLALICADQQREINQLRLNT